MTTASIRRGIVVGIDGSDSALAAARWAASAAHRLNEPVHLTHLLPKRPRSDSGTAIPADNQVAQALRADGEKLLDAAEVAVREDGKDVVLERSVHFGPPARALVEMSQTARMLVLGRAGTSEMKSRFVGSDVIRVSNHAKCPVVVWRGKPDREVPDTRPVVVGVDGSGLSGSAIAHAFEFASFFGAPLVAVHTWPEQSTLGYAESTRFVDWTPHEQHEAAVMTESLAGWEEKYPDVAVTRSVERGAPGGALLRHSAEAQLVVVGSHGHSPFMGAVLGSTSQTLLHHALCPVLICREG